MIARWWRGWTASRETTEAYEELLRTTIFPTVRSHDGCRGTYLFRRDLDGGGAEFATLTLWESWDAVRGFAGDDHEVAVVPKAARAVLERFDDRSTHYEVVESPGDY
jgi:heme-degrading monooxygenase HmoA